MATYSRPWESDPDLRAAVDRLLVHLSSDIYARRRRHGWSQEQLATVAGVSRDTILTLEQARGDPHLSTLVRLYWSLGTALDIRAMSVATDTLP